MRPSVFSLIVSALALNLYSPAVFADVQYDVRVETRDRVRGGVFGNVKLGSFGAPGINDQGAVAFAAVVFGQNVGALNNGSVIYQRTKRKSPEMILQTGERLSSSFRSTIPDNSRYVPGSSRAFRIGRDVALNRKNQAAFTSEMIYATQTVSKPDKDDIITFGDPVDRNYSSYGLGSKRGKNFVVEQTFAFESFTENRLKTTLSLNRQGSVGVRALYKIGDKRLEGIAYSGYRLRQGFPDYDGSLISTVESPVIGLPYFTVFSSFSDPIVSDKNKLFVVADISDDGDEFDGIWQGNNPNLQPIVVKDTSAPGGGTFASFDGSIGASRKGTTVAFIADVVGARTNRAVYRAGVTGKAVTLVVALGDNAPSNSNVGDLGRFAELELTAVNNRGEVAVLGGVPGSRRGTRSGIWISNRAGDDLRLVVVEGQDLFVDGKVKRITRIAFNPVAGFNNKSEVAFTASFSDRTSAVVVASVK
ncbi:MAG: choice-of-anchor tandem repeat NxxGxxAF-containing protein [Chthoniobacterales bacterium]